MSGIGPRLPLSIAPSLGFALTQTLPENIRQNLKNVFLTNPGERIMDPNFGIGIKKYLFEQNIEYTHGEIKTKSLQQIKRYMPFLTISNIDINQDLDDRKHIIYFGIIYNRAAKSNRCIESNFETMNYL